MRLELKFAILRARKTQRSLGSETGIPETRMSDIVQGRTMPRPDERAALSRALGVPSELLFPTESQPQHVA
jgi:transcriptional regulator with XRE-family HTH domain